jgi:hypothetical protein
MPATTTSPSVLVRPATAADAGAVALLAALDSSTVPSGDLLLAEVDGRLRAAIGLDDRAVIADPFVPTAELAMLLRTRAGQLRAPRPARARPRLALRALLQ